MGSRDKFIDPTEDMSDSDRLLQVQTIVYYLSKDVEMLKRAAIGTAGGTGGLALILFTIGL